MRFKQLDLNLLVALDHLLALQSVSLAADRMNMSQSAMSNALTRLRTYFDDPLLVQVGRRMELTPRAESMQMAVRDILVRVEATIQSAPVFDPANSNREFKILLSDYTMSVLMPHVLALADEEGSSVRFNLLAQTDQPYLLLDQGEADMLIAPSVIVSPDHPSEHVYRDRYVCVVWRDGRYGSAPLTQEMFREAGHAIMVPPNRAHSFETEALAAHGVERRIEVRTFSFSVLPNLIVGTDRIATVHGHIARNLVGKLPLSVHPLPFDIGVLDQTMQWHGYRDTDPGLIWLRGLMRRAGAMLDDH